MHWCRSPVLDAVFSSYFSQAEQQGVRVDAEIRLSEQLSVDEAELALVFANALENAINACMRLPKEEREISCHVIAHPRLMFQIANPTAEPVPFGKDGLPLASEARSPGRSPGRTRPRPCSRSIPRLLRKIRRHL